MRCGRCRMRPPSRETEAAMPRYIRGRRCSRGGRVASCLFDIHRRRIILHASAPRSRISDCANHCGPSQRRRSCLGRKTESRTAIIPRATTTEYPAAWERTTSRQATTRKRSATHQAVNLEEREPYGLAIQAPHGKVQMPRLRHAHRTPPTCGPSHPPASAT